MKTLNDFFSKIYCINLDRRPDRWEESLKEFEKLNINVERVSAVDGGVSGLTLTNYNIIKEAIFNNYKNILILEDDIKFINNFYEKFNAKIEYLPNNWDLLYLGGCNEILGRNIEIITGNKNIEFNINTRKLLDYEICKTKNNTIVTHAVGINSKFYKFLIEEINKKISEPIDLIQGSMHGNYNAYTFIPSLAAQRSSYSDIKNRLRH